MNYKKLNSFKFEIFETMYDLSVWSFVIWSSVCLSIYMSVALLKKSLKDSIYFLLLYI